MTGATVAPATVNVTVVVLVPAVFVAVTVTTYVPGVVGVPLMIPVAGSRVNPGGSPVAVKLVGTPVAIMGNGMIGVPTVPGAVTGPTMMGTIVADAIVMVRVEAGKLVPVVFVAVSVTIVTPAALGVPVMAPVTVSSTSPAGRGLAV
jgi:hypothetical protein